MSMLTVLFRALLLLCIGLATSASTCLHATNPGGLTDAGAIDAPQTFADCTTDNVKSIALGIQGDIANALASNDYEAEIATLVAKFTIGEVKCALEIFVGSNARKADADALMRLQISRANSWLSTH